MSCGDVKRQLAESPSRLRHLLLLSGELLVLLFRDKSTEEQKAITFAKTLL